MMSKIRKRTKSKSKSRNTKYSRPSSFPRASARGPTLNLHRALNPLPNRNPPLNLSLLWRLAVASLPSVLLTLQSKVDGALDQLRPRFSGHGYPTQRAANTSSPRSDLLRRWSQATGPCEGTTARRCLCLRTGSGITEARPHPRALPRQEPLGRNGPPAFTLCHRASGPCQSGWPLPRVHLNQGDPPCSSPAWPRMATGSYRFRRFKLRVFYNSRQFTVHLFRPWISSSARGKGGGPREKAGTTRASAATIPRSVRMIELPHVMSCEGSKFVTGNFIYTRNKSDRRLPGVSQARAAGCLAYSTINSDLRCGRWAPTYRFHAFPVATWGVEGVAWPAVSWRGGGGRGRRSAVPWPPPWQSSWQASSLRRRPWSRQPSRPIGSPGRSAVLLA